MSFKWAELFLVRLFYARIIYFCLRLENSELFLTFTSSKQNNDTDFMEYRNENNRKYNDGKHFVASYDGGNAKFIGTYEECEKYINENLDGDFDDYGIFQN